MKNILEINNLTVNFGGVVALLDVSFDLYESQVLSLIGPNGAGKTTLFNCITGFIKPANGNIVFSSLDITNIKPYDLVKSGIVRTFQNIRLFSQINVLENVLCGAHTKMNSSILQDVLKSNKVVHEEKKYLEKAREYLNFVGLSSCEYSYPNELPYGMQRRLELARALISEPRLLLLDEPTAGMNPAETNELISLISKLCARGITIFLIEHDMNVVMNLSNRIVVLDHGEKIAEGTPVDIKNNKRVIEAYLGQSKH